MISLLEILRSTIKYVIPKFAFEWEEATRYPEFEELGKDGWVDLASRGYTVKWSEIRDFLGNVDLDFRSLEPAKVERFKKAYANGIIEMPIAVKFSDSDYDLVAGNTRLSGLVNMGEDPTLWVVEAP